MSPRVYLLLALMFCFPLGSHAQQSPPERQQLTDQQKDGRRIFQQRCAICHTPPTVTSKRYGPALYGDVVDGYEDGVRQMIMEGREQLMPGFKYTLSRPEIDSIIEYLRIVPKPARAPKSGSQQNTID
jgi:mono/diheme cytochrome c family protein